MISLKPGLRRSVALSFAVFAMLFVMAQTVVIYFVTDDQEEEFIDRVLDDEMRVLVQQFGLDPGIEPPHTDVMTGFIVRTPAESAQLPVQLRNLNAGTHEVFVNGTEFHVQVLKLGEVMFYLLYDATRHETRIEEFRTFLLLLMLASAAMAPLLGFWLSGRLVRQVSDLADRVERLNPDAEHAPLADGYRDEEVIKLASAFDHYHRRMAQLVRREKEFTANVSHELRTPLTAITTGCELLAQDPKLQGKSRLRLEAIGNAAERITESMEGLLFLAREIPVIDNEPTEIAEAIEDALGPVREILSSKAIAVEVRVQRGSLLRVHRPALTLVLSNLIRNAVDYTDRGRITVAFARDTLSVSDTGHGIPETDLPHVFERTYRASQGRHAHGKGIGLSIVRRIADRFNWRIEVVSRVNVGSTFTISFPEYSLVQSVAVSASHAA